MFIDNTKYGNPHLALIEHMKTALSGHTNSHVTAFRPGPQEKHMKYEIVVSYQGFESYNNGLRGYIFHVELYSLTSKEEHLSYVYELSDILNNLGQTKNITDISVTNIIGTVEVTAGERAHITDLEVTCLVHPENLNN